MKKKSKLITIAVTLTMVIVVANGIYKKVDKGEVITTNTTSTHYLMSMESAKESKEYFDNLLAQAVIAQVGDSYAENGTITKEDVVASLAVLQEAVANGSIAKRTSDIATYSNTGNPVTIAKNNNIAGGASLMEAIKSTGVVVDTSIQETVATSTPIVADNSSTKNDTIAQVPTQVPTQAQIVLPTQAPVTVPVQVPTEAPTTAPTQTQTVIPTEAPTQAPTQGPTSSVVKPRTDPIILTDAQGMALAKVNAVEYAAFAQELVNLINQYRTDNGWPALVYDKTMGLIAMQRAVESAYAYTPSHTRPNGTLCSTILAVYGVPGSMGENLVTNASSPISVFDSWLNSTGHEAQMLTRVCTTMGVGVALDSTGLYYCYACFH